MTKVARLASLFFGLRTPNFSVTLPSGSASSGNERVSFLMNFSCSVTVSVLMPMTCVSS
jgi:hypothetical protein